MKPKKAIVPKKTIWINAYDSLMGTLESEMGDDGSKALNAMCELSKDKEYQEFADRMEKPDVQAMTPSEIADMAKKHLKESRGK